MNGTLYVVATPIGNREDITQRAVKILREADLIAAEDTRNTKKLLGMYDISNKTVSNHKFNEQSGRDRLLSYLLEGKSIAIVSDAGTPCISDPGSVLIEAAAESGVPVIGVCGANAAVTALSISGFDCAAFSFYGFLPRKEKEIRDVFMRALKSDIRVCVFYESPKRIIKTIELLQGSIPDARLCVCNDLTKLHERTYRGDPSQVLGLLNGNPNAEKGEYTIVAKLPEATACEETEEAGKTNEGRIIDYMVLNNASAKEAVAALAGNGASKKELYAAALRLKDMFA